MSNKCEKEIAHKDSLYTQPSLDLRDDTSLVDYTSSNGELYYTLNLCHVATLCIQPEIYGKNTKLQHFGKYHWSIFDFCFFFFLWWFIWKSFLQFYWVQILEAKFKNFEDDSSSGYGIYRLNAMANEEYRCGWIREFLRKLCTWSNWKIKKLKYIYESFLFYFFYSLSSVIYFFFFLKLYSIYIFLLFNSRYSALNLIQSNVKMTLDYFNCIKRYF